MSLQELEKRIQVLEDTEAIKRLKARYSRIIDGPCPEEVGKIVTENAVLVYGNLGTLKGRTAISDYFKKYPDIRSFRVHYFSQPEITVDGDCAYGRWYMWVPCSTGDGRAIWSSGYEEEKYEKVHGEWLIAELKLISIFRTPYEEGWHKRKFIDEN
jgi:ketosteroid isomerase-like protein